MNLETVISQFGYPALVIGLLLEGETVLVLGAFMAHRGYLNLPVVIALGCVVSFSADQFFFWLGRTQGSRFLESRPRWKPHVDKARSLLGRNPDMLSLGVRFMYGLRTVLPFVMGMSKFNPKRFALFDLLGSVLWSLTFGLAGKFIGHLIEAIFKDFKRHEAITIVGVMIIAGAVWLYHSWLARKQGTI